MSKPVFAASMLAALLFTGAAFAAAPAAVMQTSGVIKSYSGKSHTVTLEDGSHYTLAKGVSGKGLKVGRHVDLTYHTAKGARHVVSDLKIEK